MAVNRAIVVALVLMGLVAMAQYSEAAGKQCAKDLFTPLKPCIPAISGDNPQKPTQACCQAVRSADLDCLCAAISSNKPPVNFKPNVKALLALPKNCNRVIPKDYTCKGIKL